jgi:hypothetical protein
MSTVLMVRRSVRAVLEVFGRDVKNRRKTQILGRGGPRICVGENCRRYAYV